MLRPVLVSTQKGKQAHNYNPLNFLPVASCYIKSEIDFIISAKSTCYMTTFYDHSLCV